MLSRILSESLSYVVSSRERILAQSDIKSDKKKSDKVAMEIRRKLQRIIEFINETDKKLSDLRKVLEVTSSKNETSFKKIAEVLTEINEIENQMYELHQLKSRLIERLGEKSKIAKEIIQTIDKSFKELKTLRDKALKISNDLVKKKHPDLLSDKDKKVAYIMNKLLGDTFNKAKTILKSYGFKKFPKIGKSIYHVSGIESVNKKGKLARIRFARFIELFNLPIRLSTKTINKKYLVLFVDLVDVDTSNKPKFSSLYVALVDDVVDPFVIKGAYEINSIKDANIAIAHLFFENKIEIIPSLESPQRWRDRRKQLAKKGILHVIGVNDKVKTKIKNKQFLVKVPLSELGDEIIDYINKNKEMIENTPNNELIVASKLLTDIYIDVARILGLPVSRRKRKSGEKLSKEEKKLLDKSLRCMFKVEGDDLIITFVPLPKASKTDVLRVYEGSPEHVKRTTLRTS